MAIAAHETMWRMACALEERGVWQQRLPSQEEYRCLKAALKSAAEFSKLLQNTANTTSLSIPEFVLNFRVRTLLSDQLMAESLYPGRAPLLTALPSGVKKQEDDYDAPAEPRPTAPGPPVAKFPLDDMYYTLEENHEDWFTYDQQQHRGGALGVGQVGQAARDTVIKIEPPAEAPPAPVVAPTTPVPAPAVPVAPAIKESPEPMNVDQVSEASAAEQKQRADPSSDSRRAEEKDEDDDDGDDSDEEDGDDKSGRRKRGTKSSRELRNLLSDVKLAKKWQAELYEALDNVLKQARDLKDYSYPFLRPVRKGDAPDYYKVIKSPMDFKTMAKKLRKAEYNSKKEFQSDLNLIYSNCRKYNTDNDSPFRACADEVESLTKKLMVDVPNLDITQAKKEAAAKAKEEGVPPPADSPKSPSSEEEPPKKKSKARVRGKKEEAESPQVSKKEEALVPSAAAETPQSQDKGRGKARRSDGSSGQPLPAPTKEEMHKAQQVAQQHKEAEMKRAEEARKATEAAALKKKEEDNRRAQAQKNPERLVDPQNRLWRDITRDERVRFVLYRQAQSSMPFGEREALVRTPESMSQYATAASSAATNNSGIGFFPEYSHPASCIPDLPQRESSNPAKQHPAFVESNQALKNAQRLTKIRDLRNRLLPDLGDGPAPPEEPLPSPNVNPQPSHYTERLNGAILRRSLTVLLAQAGFQSTSRNALEVFTDVVQQFLRKLCRILRLRLQEPIPSGDVEEPIHLALVEMGASGYQALRQYYLSSVLQYGKRLEDLEGRLTARVERAAQFATAEAAPEEELEEDDVAFLSGAFGEGVQLDVLGLGEIGMEGLAVPAQLLAPASAQRKRKVVAPKPATPAPDQTVPQTPVDNEAEGEEEGEEGDEDDDEESYDEEEDDDRKRKHLSSGFLPQKKTRADESLLT